MNTQQGTTWQVCSGVLLLALGVFGLSYAWRASRSYGIYHRVKYSNEQLSLPAILQSAEKAHRLYSHNYRFCQWTAEQATQTPEATDAESRERYLRAAENWADVGLGMNRFSGPLQLLKARLLQRDDPSSAARSWKKYVDWHFWEPYNHAVLVDLYASAGDFSRAAEALEWVKTSKSKHTAWAQNVFERAWRAEMALPVN